VVFELLLNAVKVAVSKDARESAASVVELLRRSPDWEKAIGTIEARVSIDVRERVQLIEDLVADKLVALSYKPASIAAFRTALTELAANAFEHGIVDAKRAVVRVLVETSPSYVATTVHNPKGSTFQLADALEAAARHRLATSKTGRGRGLVLVSRRVDVVQMVGDDAVKTLVYRDAVEIETHKAGEVIIAVVAAGHANPSLPRRIRDYLDDHPGEKIVLCLDAKEFEELVLADVQRRNAVRPDICIVAGGRDIVDLMPDVGAAPTIEMAIAQLLRG